jgi:hypothetical protein
MGEEEYLILQHKFQEWFKDSVPADTPLAAETNHLKHVTTRRKRVTKSSNLSSNLLGLIFHGFGGAVFFGSIVGFIIYILNTSLGGWTSNSWLIQFWAVFLAMVIGFYISLVKKLAR